MADQKDKRSTQKTPKKRTVVRFKALWVLLGLLILLIGLYATIFQILMTQEEQRHSWADGIYWVVVTMSTLGYGDITFDSYPGRIFSIIVILSGVTFLLVILPFVLIQFVVMPWMERRSESRVPRAIGEDVEGHVILTKISHIEESLIARLKSVDMKYVVLIEDYDEASRLHDLGYKVMLGDWDDPDTYKKVRANQAALFVANRSDVINTNITFTLREVAPNLPIVSTAASHASVDILELAGATNVVELGVLLGRIIAQRVLGTDATDHIVGQVKGISISEVGVSGAQLAGKTIGETGIRSATGVSVVGIWNRGRYDIATAETLIEANSVLILAGSFEQLESFDQNFKSKQNTEESVLIIGGGRVGRQVGESLRGYGLKYKIIEKQSERVLDPDHYIAGDAADLRVLESAGIRSAHAVAITTHDDDVNVYLTIYCRRLRPDIQIIARANTDRNTSTLYRAGADAVLSYASTGATNIWNTVFASDTVLLADGLEIRTLSTPDDLVRQTLATSDIRESTGVNVVAIEFAGIVETDPNPNEPIPAGSNLVLIGDEDAFVKFHDTYQNYS
ncbi:MAG: potassium channel protein [Actinobacteria bacterium]|nr:potassium channel protein [Actinomycetota bacterium]